MTTSISKFHLLILAAVLAAGSILSVNNFTAGASDSTSSVIVQLKADPVVVAKHQAATAGQSFDEEAYRREVVADQDEFLSALRSAGVDASVASVDAPNGPAGELANIAFRFNYVYNGIALNVPASAIPVIEGMSQVKSVEENAPIELHLNEA